MADFEKFFRKILKSEGTVYTNHPLDKGGPTKYGVTINTWKSYGYDKDGDGMVTANDIRLLTAADAGMIARKVYWNVFEGDLIKNQSVAEIIVDWAWNSGPATAAARIRPLLGLAPGARITAREINKAPPKALFEKIKQARISYIKAIIKNKPSQQVFYAGWMNRINAFSYIAAHPGKTLAALAIMAYVWFLVNKLNKQ